MTQRQSQDWCPSQTPRGPRVLLVTGLWWPAAWGSMQLAKIFLHPLHFHLSRQGRSRKEAEAPAVPFPSSSCPPLSHRPTGGLVRGHESNREHRRRPGLEGTQGRTWACRGHCSLPPPLPQGQAWEEPPECGKAGQGGRGPAVRQCHSPAPHPTWLGRGGGAGGQGVHVHVCV